MRSSRFLQDRIPDIVAMLDTLRCSDPEKRHPSAIVYTLKRSTAAEVAAALTRKGAYSLSSLWRFEGSTPKAHLSAIVDTLERSMAAEVAVAFTRTGVIYVLSLQECSRLVTGA